MAVLCAVGVCTGGDAAFVMHMGFHAAGVGACNHALAVVMDGADFFGRAAEGFMVVGSFAAAIHSDDGAGIGVLSMPVNTFGICGSGDAAFVMCMGFHTAGVGFCHDALAVVMDSADFCGSTAGDGMVVLRFVACVYGHGGAVFVVTVLDAVGVCKGIAGLRMCMPQSAVGSAGIYVAMLLLGAKTLPCNRLVIIIILGYPESTLRGAFGSRFGFLAAHPDPVPYLIDDSAVFICSLCRGRHRK